jgi:hypothetical protein
MLMLSPATTPTALKDRLAQADGCVCLRARTTSASRGSLSVGTGPEATLGQARSGAGVDMMAT